MRIREEEERDRRAVREMVSNEFDTGAEAELIDALREDAEPLVSLVAEDDGKIVGHAMFSPVSLAGQPDVKLMGLAPLAVLYDYRGRGIGSALVRTGIERCRALGAVAVAVLGHPEYYRRFGFTPASQYGLKCEYDVPDDVFLVLEIEVGALGGKSGVLEYHAAFKHL